MAERIPAALEEKFRSRLSFYQDIGIELFYRDRFPQQYASVTEEITLPKPAQKAQPAKATAPMSPAARKLDVLPVSPGVLPFVGRAGKLLTQMIEAMGLQRKDVYICNVVKCRPPENRTPEKDEVETCSPFLLRQLDAIAPKVIVCLGSVAAQTLLQTNRGISHFRGEWLDFRGRKLLATYHPAYLLRNPSAKGEVWKDLQKVMAVLGLQVKKGSSAGAGQSTGKSS